MFYWLAKIVCYIPIWLLYPVIKKGNRIPKGKVILICNHTSNLDPVLLISNTGRIMHCLAKKELFNTKFKRAFFKGMKAIPVDRENVELKTIKECLRVLKNNEMLTIFPEGTRNKTTEPLLELKSGAGVFSVKGNAPIVPIWIDTTGKMFHLTKFYIGESFTLKKEDLGNETAIMESKLLELREECLKNKKKSPK